MGQSTSHKAAPQCDIAIVGIGCLYPGAKNPLELWENILARRQQFREIPDVRLPLRDYYSPDPDAPDKLYQKKATVIDGYQFDWLGKRIPKRTYESTDIVHWIALDTALAAIADAGYDRESISKEKTGVVLGNTLTGEFTRSNNMLLRWPFVYKTLVESLKKKGLHQYTDAIASTMEQYYKSVFTSVNEDTLAGGLANTIAGRICNHLDLHGGGYIVDGACSSSLIAICTAANYLQLGQMDMVVAGGVDISLDTFELVGFSKTKALTRGEMRVYDKEGNGFLPGEGCGMVILKRLEDAVRDKNPIYATLKGWGISSDGKGGITAPSAEGQARALKRAHEKAGINTAQIDFIEGHGTGTTVGDRIELEGISLALEVDKNIPARSCGVTSFKSIVGHTKAAAGVGAFIKTVIAVNQRVMPPTAGLREYNPIFENQAKMLFPVLQGEVWKPDSKMLAGVSAMGFGGINSHVVLESGDKPFKGLKPSMDERKLMLSNQVSEVFLFTASDKSELLTQIDKAIANCDKMSYAEMADLASYMNTHIDNTKSLRAGVVARFPVELIKRLLKLKELTENSSMQQTETAEQNSITVGRKKEDLSVGIVFPGQGSQKLNMSSKLIGRYDWAQKTYSGSETIFSKLKSSDVLSSTYKNLDLCSDLQEKALFKNTLKQTQIAQPAITLSSLLWYQYLNKLGVTFNYAAGHSLGEIMAMHAGGYIDQETALSFASFRGKTMAGCGSGTMASLVCPQQQAQKLIEQTQHYVTIANINAPEQTVISGDEKGIDEIVALAEQQHIGAVKLPVSAAFHSKLIQDTSKRILESNYFTEKPHKASNTKVVSSVNGKLYNNTKGLKEYFAKQCVNQVNFIETVETLAQNCDILIEAGPGKVLSGLVESISNKVQCFPVEAYANDDISLNQMILNLYVQGADLKTELLYQNRLIREFIPAFDKIFLMNPLERPFPKNLQNSKIQAISEIPGEIINLFDFEGPKLKAYLEQRGGFLKDIITSDMRHMQPHIEVPNDTIKQMPVANTKNTQLETMLYNALEEATGFPKEDFKPEMKLLDDFNLDSIKAGTLLAEVSKKLDIAKSLNPINLVNASLEQIISEFVKYIPAISETSSSDSISISAQVIKLLAEQTGFPEEEIKPEYRLLNDLNLDSIKAGGIIASLSKQFAIQGSFEAVNFANASVQEITNHIISETAMETDEIDKAVQSPLSILYEIIEEKTGFPASEIKPGFRLLDDLNLDSIKAGSVIAELGKKLSIVGELEPAQLANATLNDIIEKVKQAIGNNAQTAESIDTSAIADSNDWVKGFSVELEKVPLDEPENYISFWIGKKTGIVFADSSKSEADQFAKQLEKLAITTSPVHYTKLSTIASSQIKHLFVFIPQIDSTPHQIEESVHMMADVAAYQPVQSTNIMFIQMGEGDFGRKHLKTHLNPVSASSFAASLHLERPSCKIKCLELATSISSKEKTVIILKETAHEQVFSVSGWENENTRLEMRYALASQQTYARNLDIDKNDVILVTGGAKGITAECALAMASQYKCKMALIGSSELSDQSFDILATLKRYSDQDLTAQYFQCDICNLDDVFMLVNRIKDSLGKVTGVVHGAGRNIPRRSEQASAIEVMSEIAPKVYGTYNLVDALQNNKLKCFVAFTSIIGVTGMQGNSWYAFANEVTDRLLRNLNAKHDIPTLTLAYSVWSKVGMGAKMGSVDTLAGMGIGAIPPEKGIQQFMKWLENGSNDQQIVIATRLGNLDTWKRKVNALPKSKRYLEKVLYHEPAVELVTRATLNRKSDLYVDDHNFRESRLFPTVFGIEAMSQAVAYLTGKDISQVSIENIQLSKPIVVPEQGDTIIEIKAVNTSNAKSSSDNTIIHVGISTEQSDFTDDHFSADFIFSDSLKTETYKINKPDTCLPIHPKSDLYSWLLFQGSAFQRINQVYHIDNKRVVFNTQVAEDDTSWLCFSSDKHSPFQLGSPLQRDTFLQSIQIILTRNVALPVYIDKWEIFNTHPEKGGFVECSYLKPEGNRFIADVRFVAEDGTLLERIQGYQLQKIGDYIPKNPAPEKLADRGAFCSTQIHYHIEQYPELNKLVHLAVHKISKDFHLLNKKERRIIAQEVLESLIDRDNLKELNSAKISWEENGKPVLNKKGWHISISHKNSFLILVVGTVELGCDLELVTERSHDEWNNLLSNNLSDVLGTLTELDKNINISGTRVWSALESCIKSNAALPDSIKLQKLEDNSAIMSATVAGKTNSLISFPINIYTNNKLVLSICLNAPIDILLREKSETKTIQKKGVQSTDRFTTNFLTTFKDCHGFFGKTYFTNYPHWMGAFREQVLDRIKDELMHDLGSGKYGMVTNQSSVKIYHEAKALDKVQGKLSLTDACNFDESFMDIRYQWYIMNSPDKPVLLADCHLSTTWVEILDRGIVKKSPIPQYFLNFLADIDQGTKASEIPVGISSSFISDNDLGKTIYKSAAGPRPQVQLLSHTFETGMENGNTVGNLYYSNYYDWQAKMIEKFIFKHAPKVFLKNGLAGEFFCLKSEVEHLQEAMPFESISVTMYLQHISENGLELFFEYFSTENGKKRKLAFGSNQLIWAKRNSDIELLTSSLVDKNLMKALKTQINQLSIDMPN